MFLGEKHLEKEDELKSRKEKFPPFSVLTVNLILAVSV